MTPERATKVLEYLKTALDAITKASMEAGPDTDEDAVFHIQIGNAVEDIVSAIGELEV